MCGFVVWQLHTLRNTMASNKADLDAALASLGTALADLSARVGNLTAENFDTEITGIQADIAAMAAIAPAPPPP